MVSWEMQPRAAEGELKLPHASAPTLDRFFKKRPTWDDAKKHLALQTGHLSVKEEEENQVLLLALLFFWLASCLPLGFHFLCSRGCTGIRSRGCVGVRVTYLSH